MNMSSQEKKEIEKWCKEAIEMNEKKIASLKGQIYAWRLLMNGLGITNEEIRE